jgi:hypothetical protein
MWVWRALLRICPQQDPKSSHAALGEAVGAQAWYREFRENVLMFAIPNIERLCEPLLSPRSTPIQHSRRSPHCHIQCIARS